MITEAQHNYIYMTKLLSVFTLPHNEKVVFQSLNKLLVDLFCFK